MRSTGNCLHVQNRFNEYHLVVYPSAAITGKINEEKNIFHRKFNLPSLKMSRPYIKIAGFTVKEEMETTLSRWIQNICHLQKSFTIALNNYCGIPPHSIYLRIQDDTFLRKIMNAIKILDSFIESNDCPPIEFMVKPHLIIAGGLSLPIYEGAIREYTLKSFHEEFTVDRLVLLKKDDYGPGQVINTFTLPSHGQ